MTFTLEPVAGEWYRRRDDDLLFQVIELDEDEALIEILQSDGALAQWDLYTWHAMELDAAESPENWGEHAYGGSPDEAPDGALPYRNEQWRIALFESERHPSPWTDGHSDPWGAGEGDMDDFVDFQAREDGGETD